MNHLGRALREFGPVVIIASTMSAPPPHGTSLGSVGLAFAETRGSAHVAGGDLAVVRAMVTHALEDANAAGVHEAEMELPPGRYTFSKSYAFPESITVRALRGAILIPAAKVVLTIPRFVAADDRHFDISLGGSVRLPATDDVRVAWFVGRPTGVDDCAGVRAALLANAASHTTITFGAGTYAADGLDITDYGFDTIIRGVTRAATTIRSRQGDSVFDLKGHHYVTGLQFRDLGIDGYGQARVVAPAAISWPLTLRKKVLRVDVVVDDGAPTSTIVQLDGTWAGLPALASTITRRLTGAAAGPDPSGTKLMLYTKMSGPRQRITLHADSTASEELGWPPGHSYTGRGATGHGIYIRHEHSDPEVELAGRISIEHVYISHTGGKGVYLPNAFSLALRFVDTDDSGDNGIDLQGNNTTALYDCYVHRVGSGMAAYRIRGGQATLINCNGIDGGDIWGLFGSTVAEDGRAGPARVTMIGCNVEAFAKLGVRLKEASSLTALGNTWIGGPGTPVAIESYFARVTLDQGNRFFPPRQGWRDGAPLHNDHGHGFMALGWSDPSQSQPLTARDQQTGRIDKVPTLAPMAIHGGNNAVSATALTVPAERLQVGGRRLIYGVGPPKAGPPDAYLWSVGDRIYNSQPAPGEPDGWICIQGGVPGEWKALDRVPR